jgi:hypothetical protein
MYNNCYTWYDRAQQELDEDYERGELSSKEYQQAMRDLNMEYEEAAQEAAREAYENY